MKLRARDLSAIRIERVEFASAGGVVRGLFYHAQRSATCVVICHGYSSSKHNVDPLAFYLAMEGFSALAFDFLGHKLGASSGPLKSGQDLLTNALDAVACARARAGVMQVVLAGHSMGASTAIGAAASDQSIAGVIAMATGLGRAKAFAAEMAIRGGLENRAAYVDGPPHAEITAAVDRFAERISEVAPRPLLVIAASRDAIVPPSAVKALYNAAGEPKTFEQIDATHTDCAERAKFAVVKWLRASGFERDRQEDRP